MRRLAVSVAIVGVVGTFVSADRDREFHRESTSLSLNDVSVVNDALSWGVGDDGVVGKKTGDSWASDTLLLARVRSLSSFDFTGVFFWDERHGWLVGNRKTDGAERVNVQGIVLRTTDGGEDWEVYFPLVPEGSRLLRIHFLTRYHGWIVAENGYVLLTNDGGITWRLTYVGDKADSLERAWSAGSRR